jgi:hypothetical protein
MFMFEVLGIEVTELSLPLLSSALIVAPEACLVLGSGQGGAANWARESIAGDLMHIFLGALPSFVFYPNFPLLQSNTTFAGSDLLQMLML